MSSLEQRVLVAAAEWEAARKQHERDMPTGGRWCELEGSW
jgi:hypothetical protein